MPKVVVNRCFGGFGLSDAGYRRYAKIKGFELYPDAEGSFITWWLVPPEARPPSLEGDAWYRASEEQRRASNEAHEASVLYCKDLKRDDPVLVQVVEELGEDANGQFAKLDVAEIPDDVQWHIHEYDGHEHVAENHRTW